ncbi:MAG: VanZ family protein [Lachnospiraceae bacterium]|nr:VanZ family protein [Lachnospiraceae bacterium]
MKYFIQYIKKTLRFLLKPLSFIPAILIIIMIFNFSGQEGVRSASLSRWVSTLIVRVINVLRGRVYSPYQLENMVTLIHPYVRKLAHVTEFFLLAVSVALPMYVMKIRGFFHTFLSFFICVMVAVLDEYHQTFVYGRSGSPRDVLIDSIGILIGVIVTRILGFVGRKTIFRWLA